MYVFAAHIFIFLLEIRFAKRSISLVIAISLFNKSFSQ